MKQEYINKLAEYQKPAYEALLKEKNVLDAKQFLDSSLLYFSYATMTARLYEDAGKWNIDQIRADPTYNVIEVFGNAYDPRMLLNKLTLEWVAHICNALDCLLQYVNSALVLELNHRDVTVGRIRKKLSNFPPVEKSITAIWDDSTVQYIRDIYNFSKHTMVLYGTSTLFDVICSGTRKVYLPHFKFKKNYHASKTTNELVSYYESIIGKYIAVLDAVDGIIRGSLPVDNRFHLGRLIQDGKLRINSGDASDLTIFAESDNLGYCVTRHWFENPRFNVRKVIEIMPLHKSNSVLQHLGYVDVIEVIEQGNQIGELHIDMSSVDDSVLSYHKYKFIPI